jgi:hypothetical protein
MAGPDEYEMYKMNKTAGCVEAAALLVVTGAMQ